MFITAEEEEGGAGGEGAGAVEYGGPLAGVCIVRPPWVAARGGRCGDRDQDPVSMADGADVADDFDSSGPVVGKTKLRCDHDSVGAVDAVDAVVASAATRDETGDCA